MRKRKQAESRSGKIDKEKCNDPNFPCLDNDDRKEKEEEEKIRRNSVNDYKYFDYFTDTTSIGDNAFNDERNLESIIIPDSVVSIGKNAFLRCSYLDSVTFPEGLTSIGNGAFLGCDRLQKIYIPRSIDGIVRATIESGSIPKLTRRFGNNYVDVTIIYSD